MTLSMSDLKETVVESGYDPSGQKRHHYRFSRLLCGAIGILLMTASLMKATDIQLFMGQIKAYAIVSSPLLVTLIAWGLITVEWTFGVGLVIFFRPGWMLPLTGLFWLFLLVVTGWAWVGRVTQECGCYGAWVRQSPGTATVENLVFFLVTTLAWKYRPADKRFGGRTKGRIMSAAIALGLALPLLSGIPSTFKEPAAAMDLSEDMAGGVRIPGQGHIDLRRGTYLLFLMATDCPHCLEVLPEVDNLADGRELPRVIALTKNGDKERQRFIREFAPPYPLGHIEEERFWRLLGAADLPRFFLIRDGHVLKVWDNRAPTVEEVAGAMKSASHP